MRKLLFTLFVVVVLTSCNQSTPRMNQEPVAEVPTDNLGNDSRILNQDPLAKIGDIGVESILPGLTVQHHFNWDYNNIHPVYPNPAIKPMRGGYIENVITTGKRYMGTPYEYGSDRSTPTTFDCSDFTRWIYLYAIGMDLPKDSRSQAQYVRLYSKRHYTDLRKARRGDLLFFMTYLGPERELYKGIDVKNQTIGHCGIYLGNGKMLHTASAKTGGVRIDQIAGMHYQWRFVMGGSVLPPPGR
ncbi:C40 family peptidase [Ammoniphilus sp. CFH 90114]|uniref:C40 family peptidase n=1 Tax=Ammoniphilus sp. CFH 90114 TaxID=2493665 RepID=UPI00100F1266|nr:C40 family peptidase [Ammoniphilus sp. CFH 90114]RXT02793.1 NlpC/P60 family protein [Ammoniphilus sp. CFH 90114]